MHDNRLNTMVRFAALRLIIILIISVCVAAINWIDHSFGRQINWALAIVLLVFGVMLEVREKIETTTILGKMSKKEQFVLFMAGYYLGDWIDDRFYGNTRPILIVSFIFSFWRAVIFFVVWWVIKKLIVSIIRKRRQP